MGLFPYINLFVLPPNEPQWQQADFLYWYCTSQIPTLLTFANIFPNRHRHHNLSPLKALPLNLYLDVSLHHLHLISTSQLFFLYWSTLIWKAPTTCCENTGFHGAFQVHLDKSKIYTEMSMRMFLTGSFVFSFDFIKMRLINFLVFSCQKIFITIHQSNNIKDLTVEITFMVFACRFHILVQYLSFSQIPCDAISTGL